jgi:hypothetical protein
MPLNNNSSLKTTIDGFENLKNVVNNNRIALRDKLEDKNIEVSENERLSSLINKVDGLGAIDIITVTELPPIGRENQLAIITDRNANNIVFSINDTLKPSNENDIFINLAVTTRPNIYTIDLPNVNFELYINYISQVKNGVSTKLTAYTYKKGVWVQVASTECVIFDNGIYPSINETGNVVGSDSTVTISNKILTLEGNNNILNAYSEKGIDLTPYSKLKLVVTEASVWNHYETFRVGFTKSMGASDWAGFIEFDKFTGEKTIEVDLSNIQGVGYFKVWLIAEYYNTRPTLKIKKMWLE